MIKKIVTTNRDYRWQPAIYAGKQSVDSLSVVQQETRVQLLDALIAWSDKDLTFQQHLKAQIAEMELKARSLKMGADQLWAQAKGRALHVTQARILRFCKVPSWKAFHQCLHVIQRAWTYHYPTYHRQVVYSADPDSSSALVSPGRQIQAACCTHSQAKIHTYLVACSQTSATGCPKQSSC